MDAKQLVKPTPLLCPLLVAVAALPAELVLAVAVAAELVIGAVAAGECAPALVPGVVVVDAGLGGVLALRTLKMSADRAVRTTSYISIENNKKSEKKN